jgi:hypothetical protein
MQRRLRLLTRHLISRLAYGRGGSGDNPESGFGNAARFKSTKASQHRRWRYAFVSLVLGTIAHGCSEPSRAPTTPSAAAPSAATLNWGCGRQQTGSTAGTGWVFASAAATADCPAVATFARGLDVGVGLITAAPADLRATVTGPTVRLDWTPVPETVISHRVEAGSGPGLADLAVLHTGNAAPSLIAGGVPNGTYYVRVRGIGPDGVPGPPSAEVIVRVGDRGCSAAPLAPTAFRATVAGNQVNLAWAAPAAADSPTSYSVEAGSAPTLSNIVTFDTGSAATSLAATAPNGVYYARVRGRNACGTGAASNEFIVTVPQSTSEICGDGRDNDGDGLVDEGCGPSSEICGDGRDNDGNGLIDENCGPCSYSVSPGSVALAAIAGGFEVTVSTAPGCAWSVASQSGFISPSGGSSGTGTGSARFSVSANTGTTIRTGAIRLFSSAGERQVSVSQVAPPPPPPTITTPPIESQVQVPPQPEVIGQQTISTPAPPTKPPDAEEGPIVGTVGVAAGPVINGQQSINAQITSTNAIPFNTVIVAGGASPGASPSHLVISLASLRTSVSLTLTSLVGQPFTAQFAVTRNSELPLNYVAATVTTTPPPCSYALAGPATPLASGGGAFNVSVTTAAGCAWSATSLSPFISVNTGSGTGAGTAQFSIAANPGPASRSGTVRIAGQDVTVTQAAPSSSCAFSVTPSSVNVSWQGGQFTLTVTGTASCGWSAASLSSFITPVSGSSGTGNGTTTFAASQIIQSTSRTGTVRVSWTGGFQDVSVSQPPPPCFYATATSLNFSASATTFNVPITVTAQPPLTPTTCASWSASTPSSFMTVVSPGPFSGSGQTSVNLASNTGALRTGTVRISFGGSFFDITVTQAAGAANVAPRITSPNCSNPPTGPGGMISCNGSAIDDNAGDVLTWVPTAAHTCTWFTVAPYTPSNPLNVLMRGTVPAGFSGTCNINFAVCDGNQACTSWVGSHTWNP